MENIDKMINCGDPSYGGAMYGCIHCGNLKFVPFRCHSRFCPTCGNKYSMDRTTSMSFKLVNVRHRHCVFTIDASLRDFFLQDRSLLNCLFHSYHNHRRVSLEELYEKAMSRSRGKRSSA
ncbi:MAG: transposase zinc-binding domain-containing protein [Anaerostipes hadrus]